jgi:hypothetical protein
MITILSKSVQGEIPRNFKSIRWNSSNNLPDTATKTFWQVDTKFRKFKVIEFMKMKSFFSSISITEMRCLYDAPGVLFDDLYVNAIIALGQTKNKDILLQRINFLQRLTGKREWSWNLFFTLSKATGYRITECRSAIRPATKYSGYVRNSSAVGSKKSRKSLHLEPEIGEWNKIVKIDFLEYLTVGEFSTGQPGDLFFTLTRTKSSKRSKNLNFPNGF